MSTGVGPFTYYTSGYTSGSGRGSARTPVRAAYATGPSPAQIARARKEQQAALIAQRLDAMHRLHRASFSPLTRRTAELPALPPFSALLREEEKKALAALGFFSSARRPARERAREAAELRAQQLLQAARTKQARAQAELDRTWQRILDNEAVPDRFPTRTASGNLSLRQATKTQRAEWYRQLVAGHVLVSVKETLAVAPGADSVTVVAVRRGPAIEALVAGRLTRASMQRAPYTSESAWTILTTEATDLQSRTTGVTQSLQPLDLSSEPELGALVAAVDLGEPR